MRAPYDLRAVVAEERAAVVPLLVGQAPDVPAVRVHDVDVEAAAAVGAERDAGAVGRADRLHVHLPVGQHREERIDPAGSHLVQPEGAAPVGGDEQVGRDVHVRAGPRTPGGRRGHHRVPGRHAAHHSATDRGHLRMVAAPDQPLGRPEARRAVGREAGPECHVLPGLEGEPVAVERQKPGYHLNVPDDRLEAAEPGRERRRTRVTGAQRTGRGVEPGVNRIADLPSHLRFGNRRGVRRQRSGAELSGAAERSLDSLRQRLGGDDQGLRQSMDPERDAPLLPEPRGDDFGPPRTSGLDDPGGPDHGHGGIGRAPLQPGGDLAVVLGWHPHVERLGVLRPQDLGAALEGDVGGFDIDRDRGHEPIGSRGLYDGLAGSDAGHDAGAVHLGDLGFERLPGDLPQLGRGAAVAQRLRGELDGLAREQDGAGGAQGEQSPGGVAALAAGRTGNEDGHRRPPSLDPRLDLGEPGRHSLDRASR